MTIQLRVHFDKSKLEFKLLDPDISPALEKKFLKIGMPEIWLHLSPRHIDLNIFSAVIVNGLSDSIREENHTARIANPVDDGVFHTEYDPNRRVFILTLDGCFDCGKYPEDSDITNYAGSKFAYIETYLACDIKGKNIKYPKDEYGIANRVSASVTGSYKIDGLYQIPVIVEILKSPD